MSARAASGISSRELARRAGVATSTVTRVENGQLDPTFTMLSRLVSATGHDVRIDLRPSDRTRRSEPAVAGPQLADLADAWTSTAAGIRPDWTRLRVFIDHLVERPHLVPAAIDAPPHLTRSAFVNALLAGIADKLADDVGASRPTWTRDGRRLRRTWYSPGTPSMRRVAREESPPQLLARGIAIRERSLWRRRTHGR